MTKIQDLKQGKDGLRYVFYKLSDDKTKIVVESSSSSEEWEDFSSTFSDSHPRFAAYRFTIDDVQKILFISWQPDFDALHDDPDSRSALLRVKQS